MWNRNETNNEVMKTTSILYLQTSGIDSPERLYSPFILAQTAKAMGIEASVFFLLKGVGVMKKGEANKIKIADFPILSDVIKKTMEMGISMYVCEQSSRLVGIEPGDYIDDVKIVGAATLNDLALETDTVMTF